MNPVNLITVRRVLTFAALMALVAPCVTGCSSDRPPDYRAARTDNGYNTDVTTPPTVAADSDPSPVKSSSPLTSDQDPLVQAAGDPLGRGADRLNPGDRLAADTTTPAKPSADDDPLLRQNVSSGTEHSHWLRGSIVNASVEVRLNSVWLANLINNIDKDITRNCHKGLNTITFTYTPHGSDSSALLNVLESEHDPPIAPLAMFNTRDSSGRPAGDDASSSTLGAVRKPITRTFTFIAQ